MTPANSNAPANVTQTLAPATPRIVKGRKRHVAPMPCIPQFF